MASAADVQDSRQCHLKPGPEGGQAIGDHLLAERHRRQQEGSSALEGHPLSPATEVSSAF